MSSLESVKLGLFRVAVVFFAKIEKYRYHEIIGKVIKKYDSKVFSVILDR